MDKKKLANWSEWILIAVGVGALCGIVLTTIWNWFISYEFGLKPLTAQAFVGLALLIVVVLAAILGLNEQIPSK